MKNDFANEIKAIEDELLALKTAAEYTSLRSANYTSSATVNSGIYQITYETSNEPIFSIVYCGDDLAGKGFIYARTPSNNTQIIEADTTYYDFDTQTYVTVNVPVSIISNRAVTGIARIS